MIIDNEEYDLTEKYNVNIYDNNTLKIKLIGITNITDMCDMFSWCSSLISLPDINNWNTNNVLL